MSRRWTIEQRHFIHLARSEYDLSWPQLTRLFNLTFPPDFAAGPFTADQLERQYESRYHDRNPMWRREITRDTYTKEQEGDRDVVRELIRTAAARDGLTLPQVNRGGLTQGGSAIGTSGAADQAAIPSIAPSNATSSNFPRPPPYPMPASTATQGSSILAPPLTQPAPPVSYPTARGNAPFTSSTIASRGTFGRGNTSIASIGNPATPQPAHANPGDPMNAVPRQRTQQQHVNPQANRYTNVQPYSSSYSNPLLATASTSIAGAPAPRSNPLQGHAGPGLATRHPNNTTAAVASRAGNLSAALGNGSRGSAVTEPRTQDRREEDADLDDGGRGAANSRGQRGRALD